MSTVHDFTNYPIRRGLSWRFTFRLRFIPEEFRVPPDDPTFAQVVEDSSIPADISGRNYMLRIGKKASYEEPSAVININRTTAEFEFTVPPTVTAMLTVGEVIIYVLYKNTGDATNIWTQLLGTTEVI